jgi:hypothetical protein
VAKDHTRSGKVAGAERVLRIAQRNGLRKGVLGTSRGWLYVFFASVLLRRLRRAVGSEPEVVFRGELRPGQAFSIDHLAQTYGGRRVRVRKR